MDRKSSDSVKERCKKLWGYIVKDFKISARKTREFHMKQDCFSSTYFMFRSFIKEALMIQALIFLSVFYFNLMFT